MKALEKIKPLLRSARDFTGEVLLFATISAVTTKKRPQRIAEVVRVSGLRGPTPGSWIDRARPTPPRSVVAAASSGARQRLAQTALSARLTLAGWSRPQRVHGPRTRSPLSRDAPQPAFLRRPERRTVRRQEPLRRDRRAP